MVFAILKYFFSIAPEGEIFEGIDRELGMRTTRVEERAIPQAFPSKIERLLPWVPFAANVVIHCPTSPAEIPLSLLKIASNQALLSLFMKLKNNWKALFFMAFIPKAIARSLQPECAMESKQLCDLISFIAETQREMPFPPFPIELCPYPYNITSFLIQNVTARFVWESNYILDCARQHAFGTDVIYSPEANSTRLGYQNMLLQQMVFRNPAYIQRALSFLSTFSPACLKEAITALNRTLSVLQDHPCNSTEINFTNFPDFCSLFHNLTKIIEKNGPGSTHNELCIFISPPNYTLQISIIVILFLAIIGCSCLCCNFKFGQETAAQAPQNQTGDDIEFRELSEDDTEDDKNV